MALRFVSRAQWGAKPPKSVTKRAPSDLLGVAVMQSSLMVEPAVVVGDLPRRLFAAVHSDSAIPILMANDDRPVTLFDYYYYASDRWGGWPLMTAKVLHQSTGLRWTDQSLHYVRTIWIFSDCWF